MTKFKRNILNILKLVIGVSVITELYYDIKRRLGILFCQHVYQTWDMRLNATGSRKLSRFHGKVFDSAFRKCVKCDKGAEYLRMIPGQYGWEKTDRELPKNKKVIDVQVMGFGEETVEMKRDRVINSILK